MTRQTLPAPIRSILPRGIFSVALLLALVVVPVSGYADNVQVIVETDDPQLHENILAFLSIAHAPPAAEWDEGRIRALHARAQQEIKQALEPLGYYRAQVRARLTNDNGLWLARYRIDPGPAMRFDKVDITVTGEAENDEAFRSLLVSVPLVEGEVVNHAYYEETKRSLLNLANERGYFDAKLTRNELRIDLPAYRGEATLHLDSGARYRFGDVRITQDILDDKLLAGFVPFKPGEPYLTSTLLKLQTDLNDSEYFQRVDVRPRRDLSQSQLVPIEVTLTPRPRDKYTTGLGYGTDTGVRGKLGWERRYLNPEGHRLTTEFELSEIRGALDARYQIPIWDPRTDRLVFSTSYTDDHPISSSSQILNIGVGVQRTRGRWQQSVALNYRGEQFETGEDAGRTGLLMPSATAIYIIADDRLHPSRGRRFQIDVRGSDENLGSDTTFFQTIIGNKFIRPFGAGGRFIMRADGGYTSIDDFSTLPASLRFYAGGSQSVRGYGYQSLGPKDDQGDVIGGKYLLFGSLEYEHHVWEDWSAGIFYDIGKAFNDSVEPFSAGVGVGARWRLPIGLLNIDLARPLDLDGDHWRIHVSIGPEL